MKNAWRSPGLGAALIVLLTVAAYMPVLRGGFIWDDDDHLTNNPAMLSVDGLKQIWSSLAVSRYYPLTLTSFWVQRHFWGLHPLPYHAVNIALQATNAVLLWALLRRLRVRGAWAAAALWAVHPVNVETVAWVTELKNTQSGLFLLLALMAFLRFEDGQRPGDYAMAMVCGAAAMLSKPSTVVLPGLMLLCVWWQHGRLTRKDFLWIAPFAAFAVGMSLLTIVEQRHHITSEGASGWTLSAAQRLVLAGCAVWFYAGKLLWPTGICFIYPRWELQVRSAAAWLPLAGLIVVAVTVWHFRHMQWARAAAFGLGCFVVALTPVIGFFDIFFFRYSFVADHFQYLAGIGLIALVVSAGAAICERGSRLDYNPGALIAAIVLVVLGVSTWQQVHAYQNQETLWQDTVAKNPNAWIAHNNLGPVLQSRGKIFEAISHYEQALRIKPDYADAHNNLALALLELGRVTEAIAHCERALQIQPDDPEAHNNLGNALIRLDRAPEAVKHYQQALLIKPGFADAHNNLGTALLRLGKVSEATSHYRLALRIKPDYAEAHNNLGVALAQVGRMQEAMEHWEQALRIRPDYTDAHSNLGSALLGLGKVTEAMGHYEEAVRLKPDFAVAHYNLGVVLERAGKRKEAILHYEQALRFEPDYAEADNNLSRLRAVQ
jgi:tetratricopeptide (TPR) repeat protein